jgi:hypothetical protein
MPTAITMDIEIVVQNSLIPSRMLADSVPDHPPQPKISNKLIIDETFQQRIKQFEIAKKGYLSKLHIFESEHNLSFKLKLFSEFVKLDLPELNTPALCLEEIFKTLSKQQQIRLRQVSLEIALLTQNHEKEGVDLLFECLEQGNVDLLGIYEKTFKSVFIMLSREQVESFILKQNVSALQFLLKNSEFNLNHYVIQMGGDQLLSPLCAAFELKNLDIFKMFLKNKASCLALYKDLPLAHTLLELDSKDCFHQAFFEYFLDLRGKNTINLYKTLASCILKKIKDQTLDESLKPPLRITYRKYIEILKGLESSTASKSTLAVSDFFDSSAFPEIGKLTWEEKKHLREFQLKLNELTAFASKHKTMHLGKIIDELIKEAQRIFRAGSEDSIKSINKDKIILRAQKGTECCTKMLRMLELSSKHRVTQNEIKELKALDLFFSDGDDSKDKLAKIAKKLDEIKTVAKQYKTLNSLRGQSFNRELRLIYEELSLPNLWLKRNLSSLDNIHQKFKKLLQFEIGLQETAFSQRFYNRFTSSFDNFLKNMLFQCQD